MNSMVVSAMGNGSDLILYMMPLMIPTLLAACLAMGYESFTKNTVWEMILFLLFQDICAWSMDAVVTVTLKGVNDGEGCAKRGSGYGFFMMGQVWFNFFFMNHIIWNYESALNTEDNSHPEPDIAAEVKKDN